MEFLRRLLRSLRFLRFLRRGLSPSFLIFLTFLSRSSFLSLSYFLSLSSFLLRCLSLSFFLSFDRSRFLSRSLSCLLLFLRSLDLSRSFLDPLRCLSLELSFDLDLLLLSSFFFFFLCLDSYSDSEDQLSLSLSESESLSESLSESSDDVYTRYSSSLSWGYIFLQQSGGYSRISLSLQPLSWAISWKPSFLPKMSLKSEGSLLLLTSRRVGHYISQKWVKSAFESSLESLISMKSHSISQHERVGLIFPIIRSFALPSLSPPFACRLTRNTIFSTSSLSLKQVSYSSFLSSRMLWLRRASSTMRLALVSAVRVSCRWSTCSSAAPSFIYNLYQLNRLPINMYITTLTLRGGPVSNRTHYNASRTIAHRKDSLAEQSERVFTDDIWFHRPDVVPHIESHRPVMKRRILRVKEQSQYPHNFRLARNTFSSATTDRPMANRPYSTVNPSTQRSESNKNRAKPISTKETLVRHTSEMPDYARNIMKPCRIGAMKIQQRPFTAKKNSRANFMRKPGSSFKNSFDQYAKTISFNQLKQKEQSIEPWGQLEQNDSVFY